MYKYDVKYCNCWINLDNIDTDISDYDIDDYLKNNPDIYNWDINDVFSYGTMKTAAKNIKKALSRYLKRHYGIVFYPNKVKYIIDYDDIIYIVNKDDFKPLFMAVPAAD